MLRFSFTSWIALCASGFAPLVLAPLAAGTERLVESKECTSCHTLHGEEWRGSMMHFGAASGVFQALELSVRKLTKRFGPHDEQNPTFCINCHSPIAAYDNELLRLGENEPVGLALKTAGSEGVSCTVCHSTNGPDRYNKQPTKGRFGDGIANAALNFRPTAQLTGPTEGGVVKYARGPYHAKGFEPDRKASEYLKSSNFCGACHDVRLPDTPDRGTGEPFQREQSLFTEWQNGPYATDKNPHRRVIGCRDCHMSLYGMEDPKTREPYPPGVFPTAKVATGTTEARRHALHSFTGVSLPLGATEKAFAKPEKGTLPGGMPHGMTEQRERLLRRACRLGFEGEAATAVTAVGGTVPLVVTVRNDGAGHRVPSGLSAERELWIELEVRDERRNVIYRSGYLDDRAHPETGEKEADGRTDDEDLDDVGLEIDPKTMEIRSRKLGADLNLRPFANRGVAQFSGAFLRRRGNGVERVAAFFLADQVDHGRSLPMLETIRVPFEIPVRELLEAAGTAETRLQLRARLRYRTFHPYLLRTLAAREPRLVSEKMLDENAVVTMATVRRELRIRKPAAEDRGSGVEIDVKRQRYAFTRGGHRWLFLYGERSYAEAGADCRSAGARLPLVRELEAMKLGDYRPVPGDNRDELLRERWTGEPARVDGDRELRVTYTFGRGATRRGEARADGSAGERRSVACLFD